MQRRACRRAAPCGRADRSRRACAGYQFRGLMTDEPELLSRMVLALSGRVQAPLCLDSFKSRGHCSRNPDLSRLLPGQFHQWRKRQDAASGANLQDYGAPFILLPLNGADLPEKAGQRIRITEDLLLEAENLASPNVWFWWIFRAFLLPQKPPRPPGNVLEMARWCRKEGPYATTIGLSNISFGLPARDLLNAAFCAWQVGLACVRALPILPGAGLREALDAIAVLEGSDRNSSRFIAGYSDWGKGKQRRKKENNCRKDCGGFGM